jgi:hypothetical protein
LIRKENLFWQKFKSGKKIVSTGKKPIIWSEMDLLTNINPICMNNQHQRNNILEKQKKVNVKKIFKLEKKLKNSQKIGFFKIY